MDNKHARGCTAWSKNHDYYCVCGKDALNALINKTFSTATASDKRALIDIMTTLEVKKRYVKAVLESELKDINND